MSPVEWQKDMRSLMYCSALPEVHVDLMRLISPLFSNSFYWFFWVFQQSVQYKQCLKKDVKRIQEELGTRQLGWGLLNPPPCLVWCWAGQCIPKKVLQVSWNVFIEPMRENISFSSLILYRTSLIYWLCVGGEVHLHFRRIKHLPSREGQGPLCGDREVGIKWSAKDGR